MKIPIAMIAAMEAYVAALHARGKPSLKSINNQPDPAAPVRGPCRARRDHRQQPGGGARTRRSARGAVRAAEHALARRLPGLGLPRGSPDAYRPLAELLIVTGLRIGEAVALEWSDVDFRSPSLSHLRS
jgi:integrase